jgi:hypothetical protein
MSSLRDHKISGFLLSRPRDSLTKSFRRSERVGSNCESQDVTSQMLPSLVLTPSLVDKVCRNL